MKTMSLWIIRDLKGNLWGYKNKPIKRKDHFSPSKCGEDHLILDSQLFTEITFENSPIEVEFKLKIN